MAHKMFGRIFLVTLAYITIGAILPDAVASKSVKNYLPKNWPFFGAKNIKKIIIPLSLNVNFNAVGEILDYICIDWYNFV
jgi:hypothetical protein